MSIGPAQAAGGDSVSAAPVPASISSESKRLCIQQLPTRIDHVAQEGVRVAAKIQPLCVGMTPSDISVRQPLDRLKNRSKTCCSNVGELKVEPETLLNEADRFEPTVFNVETFPPEIWNIIVERVNTPQVFQSLMMTSKSFFKRAWKYMPANIAAKAVETNPTAYMELVTHNNPVSREAEVVLPLIMKVTTLDLIPKAYFDMRDSSLLDVILRVRPELFWNLPAEIQNESDVVKLACASTHLHGRKSLIPRFKHEKAQCLTPLEWEGMSFLFKGRERGNGLALGPDMLRICMILLEDKTVAQYKKWHSLYIGKSLKEAVSMMQRELPAFLELPIFSLIQRLLFPPN